NQRKVTDGKDQDLTQEPEMIKAFRDAWEMDIHSYLAWLRNNFMLCHKLLSESGSLFVQINDDRLHLVQAVMDEIFGSSNFVAVITFRKKTMPLGAKYLENVSDYIIWYARDKTQMKYRQLFLEKQVEGDTHSNF